MQKDSFFRRIDWAAFWSATAIAFLVYFFTLGPSVGLEDSGELATAGDHLGVPHPPGYPFWTLCSWIFCRIFSFVTYQGQPTPAFAISLLSAVFGALAAGCTAMLITRSASDMLSGANKDSSATPSRTENLAAFAGGIGGSLAFAFSPVEWSQSTIVEIYSLNALFLMFVLLMSYRWMRKPSDTVLWTVAFAFGLGLTNYQVLLLAIVPLAIIIFLRDLALFRDVLLYMIPVGLSALALQIGSLFRANQFMQSDAINKLNPVEAKFNEVSQIIATGDISCPDTATLLTGCAVFIAALVIAAIFRKKNGHLARKISVVGTVFLALSFLSAIIFGSSLKSWGADAAEFAPMLAPSLYAMIALFVLVSAGLGFAAAIQTRAEDEGISRPLLIGSAIVGVLGLLLAILFVPTAEANGYTGVAFVWSKPFLFNLIGVIALFVLTAPFTKRGLAFAVPVAAGQLVIYTLLYKGALHGLTHPATWWFFWPIIWNFVLLVLVWVALPNGRSVAGAAFFAELGVSFYAYMPIVSDLRNPPMNWGYPRTWEGFKHAIMRGQYEAIKMTPVMSRQFFEQLTYYFSDLRMQFTLVAATLALVPFTFWRVVKKGAQSATRFSAIYAAAALYLLTAIVVIASEITHGEPFDIVLFNRNAGFIRSDKLLIALLGIFVAFGIYTSVRSQAITIGKRMWTDFRNLEPWKIRSLAGGVVGAVIAALFVFLNAPSGAQAPQAAIPSSPVILALPLILIAIFELVHAVARLTNFKIEFKADSVSQQWLIASGVCFAIMSIFLVALAQIKGDIQDGFIQKVKFISSHAIFAVWIGYGLVLGVKVVDSLIKRKAVTIIAAVAASLTFLIPIYENYTNDKLVFAMGSAEQNGHTFGWQFGNYQLRGANAINEELSADEEPLPNPLWPEEMTPSSVFFGGTDPGRFVPTYMIYSAKVRPDVYLITQNALADDTYMSVERDLYGDEIWIPSKDDSARSFEIYVDEVKSGKRQANGDLRVENGRVQVTGALGVMEINGILTEMMFNHEKLRRSFYVEESYVIKWMYPYLTPHGLIMKLNPNKNAMNNSIRMYDMDFWDWYWRRLLRDPAFRRDFPAQKSFSKLRAAIAGLYINSGMFAEGAQAYREACHLYPASPESSFRYAQEVLLARQQWDKVIDIMDYTDRVDPNNQRAKPFRNWAQRLKGVHEEVLKIRAEYDAAEKAKRPVNPMLAPSLAIRYLELGDRANAKLFAMRAVSNPDIKDIHILLVSANVFQQIGDVELAASTAKRAKNALNPSDGLQTIRQIAEILSAGRMHHDAAEMWLAYTKREPKDVDAFINLANAYASINNVSGCESAMLSALRLDVAYAQRKISENNRLFRIAAPMLKRMQERMLQQSDPANMFRR